MTTRRFGPLAVALGSTLLSACATMVNGTTQSTDITSDPPGATAVVLPANKTVTTPATVILERSKVHTVLFSREGFKPMTIYVNRAPSDAVLGNLIVGGMIGMATDYSNGSAWNLVPNPVHATLEPLSPPAETTAAEEAAADDSSGQ